MSTEHKKKEEAVIPLDVYIKKVTDFYEEKKKVINIAAGTCVVVVALALAYFMYYVPKRQAEAAEAIFKAERYFGMDSLQLALNGDGINLGLLDVIDKYGNTKDGNRAKYLAGICYLQLGQYDEAIRCLKKARLHDKLVSVQTLGTIGDAYMEKNDMDNAVKYYKKAATKNPNDFFTPVFLWKLGMGYEMQGKWKEALACFETLQQDYPASYNQFPESMDAEKRIAFLKGKIGK